MNGPFNSILETVGQTPIVRINNLAPEGVELFVKLEAFNPMGSVKDRMALNTIEAAEADGSLKPGQTVIEATSGNTGIGLAMVCAQKGYPLVIVMAESFSVERRRLMRFLGAKVVLTPAAEKGMGMVKKAKELAEQNGWFLTRQFENRANPDAHTRTTAKEILADFADGSLDYFVTGYGTGGTVTGVARGLKEMSHKTKVILCEPDNSRVLSSDIKQTYQDDKSAAFSHPDFRPHPMQGWAPDFVPHIVHQAIKEHLIDEIRAVSGEDAMKCARDLAAKEGIFCGTSSGATFAAALELAKTAPKGSRILAMLPDTGERYLSTPLFGDIGEDMNEEETAISLSSPSGQFAPPAVANPSPPAAPERPSDDAMAALQERVAAAPVAFFSLEWCEFCWSVRRLFNDAGIDYQTFDLDSVDYQQGGLGAELRQALHYDTGAPTIPQLYIGGTHVGGATDCFDAFSDGRLTAMLDAANVAHNREFQTNPYGYLPAWMQSR